MGNAENMLVTENHNVHFLSNSNKNNKETHDAMRTCKNVRVLSRHKISGRLTAEGVKPSSRNVLEKSERVNCFL